MKTKRRDILTCTCNELEADNAINWLLMALTNVRRAQRTPHESIRKSDTRAACRRIVYAIENCRNIIKQEQTKN